MTPIRLTAVLTHPVQYLAPWFRHVAAACPAIDLTVLYATEPTPEQQGTGFGLPFRWDAPLREGYASRIVRPARPGDDVSSARLFGLDVPEIGDALRATRPDVALLAGWHSVTQLRALATCRAAGIPALYRGDSHLGTAPRGLLRAPWAARTALLLRLFSGHLAVGTRAREYLARFGIPEWRIFDSPHAVDNAAFAAAAAPHQTPAGRAAARAALGLAEGELGVLFVGKIDDHKRVDDLVGAVARLSPGARLIVVGTGPAESRARALAARLGVPATFAGFLNQGELGRAYAAADCLALPSQSETWGLVVNEALATGLPAVVSSGVGCAPDLIGAGETGETYRMGDVADLAAALERVRRRRASGHDFAPACRARADAHGFAAASAGLLTACRAVARRPPEPRPGVPRVLALCGSMVAFTGLERMNFEVLRSLRDRGAQVHCVVNTWSNQRIVAEAERIGATWSTGFYWYRFDRHTRDPREWLRFLYDIFRTSRDLLRDAAALRPTHVLVPELLVLLRNAPALLLLRATGVEVILRVGNGLPRGGPYEALWRWAVAPLADRIVCISRFIERDLIDVGLPASKISVVYNTAASRADSATAPERHPSRVVYVGQIIPEKGVAVLLEAIALLAARGRDVHLDVVGEMGGWAPPRYLEYREVLRARAGAPDLRDRVRFLGWREDVPALLSSGVIHCCPSMPEQREGLGSVVIEAKRCGTPSVVFPCGGLPEMISQGVDGWICRDFTAEALAEGLERFLADPEARERAGRAALASFATYRPERFGEQWWSLFSPGGASP